MTEENQRFVEQLQATEKALGASLAAGPGTEVAGLRYAYQRGTVLVPAGDVHHAVAALNSTPRGGRWARAHGPEVRAGVRRVTVGAPRAYAEATDAPGDDQDVLDAIALINGRGDVPCRAAPNHVISIANVNMCPADEPEPTTDPPSLGPLDLSPPAAEDPNAPNVLVVDTGQLFDRVEPFPFDHAGGDSRVWPLDDDGYIREYAGHGTFIAELLAGVAPAANVWVSNLLPDLGAAFDDEFGGRLVDALDAYRLAHDDRWPDIISLSAGSPVMDLEEPLPGLKEFLNRLAEHPETLLVAAAGNNGEAEPFHPAALAWTPERRDGRANVVSVGALRETGLDRACFSDHGPWVSVYAPGERLVAGFLRAPLKYQHSTYDRCRFLPAGEAYDDCTCRHPRHVGELSDPGHADTARFEGLARWSGTSFATPLVAGMVARAMAGKKGADAPTLARDMIDKLVPLERSGLRAVFPDNYTGSRPTG